MPKDLTRKKILVIGSGPIIIGQGCEFDYSGTQACKALREEGCFVILVNSNPATVMTDPSIADATYIEPITRDLLEKIIEQERPDALLPTMGGQTALNSTRELAQAGILSRYNVQLIGLSLETIEYAENRQLFRELVRSLGLPTLSCVHVKSKDDLEKITHFPVIVRASFTLSGYGGGIASSREELQLLCQEGLAISPTGLLIEPSLAGWKEYELEVMRDAVGNSIVVCGIENIDPMGIHTGDSIIVAPIQTLTDKEYQKMRRQAFAIMEGVKMTSGGCNVQFAVHPTTGEMVCIEINPRVSRSSALASKATGFPIAKIATKIALGYTLHELKNDLASFPASFEPSLDYVVVKIPVFPFDKFPESSRQLSPSMKSVGETMAIGRSFREALMKAIDSLELPCPVSVLSLFEEPLSHYDAWFVREIETLLQKEKEIPQSPMTKENLLDWKREGFSDKRIAALLRVPEETIWQKRQSFGIHPTYKRIDSCAGEFRNTPFYFYSTFEEECEAKPSLLDKILVIGSGPNRIGQGLEFDYCCVHAIQAIQEAGYEAIMVNCNPSTVSTDYDLSDRLYLEPLTAEKIKEIVRIENPKGVIVQFGGQTPLTLGRELSDKNIPLLGFTSVDCCEEREKFSAFLQTLSLCQPRNNLLSTEPIDYPLIVRPSYIIGGSSIQKITTPEELALLSGPLFVEEYLEEGIEVEVDAIGDGHEVFICGVIEHLDPVGIHSGDSIASLSPLTLSQEIQVEIKHTVCLIGLSLHLIGLFNVQFCIRNTTIYVLEVNPRASRTIPLLSKITSIPFVQIATRTLLGQSLLSQGYRGEAIPRFCGIKVPLFPFNRLTPCHKKLGPQMYSTGEALSLGSTHEEAFTKGSFYIDPSLPQSPLVKKFLLSTVDTYSIYRLQTHLTHF